MTPDPLEGPAESALQAGAGLGTFLAGFFGWFSGALLFRKSGTNLWDVRSQHRCGQVPRASEKVPATRFLHPGTNCRTARPVYPYRTTNQAHSFTFREIVEPCGKTRPSPAPLYPPAPVLSI